MKKIVMVLGVLAIAALVAMNGWADVGERIDREKQEVKALLDASEQCMKQAEQIFVEFGDYRLGSLYDAKRQRAIFLALQSLSKQTKAMLLVLNDEYANEEIGTGEGELIEQNLPVTAGEIKEGQLSADETAKESAGATAVICCNELQFQEQFSRFIEKELNIDKKLTLGLPQGIWSFTEAYGQDSLAKALINTIRDKYKPSKIIILAHRGCKYILDTTTYSKLGDRQQIQNVVSLLKENFSSPATQIKAYYGEPGDDGTLRFVPATIETRESDGKVLSYIDMSGCYKGGCYRKVWFKGNEINLCTLDGKTWHICKVEYKWNKEGDLKPEIEIVEDADTAFLEKIKNAENIVGHLLYNFSSMSTEEIKTQLSLLKDIGFAQAYPGITTWYKEVEERLLSIKTEKKTPSEEDVREAFALSGVFQVLGLSVSDI